MEEQIQLLEQQAMELLNPHQDALKRVAEVPGFGVDSALQIIAEVGPGATAFESEKDLCSWVGVCPGENQSAGESHGCRSPKGNRNLRRLLTQAAHAAIRVKGSIFQVKFERLRRGLKYNEAIWAIAHRLCRLIWKILQDKVRYQEHGPAVSAKSDQNRARKMVRQLIKMGYRVEPPPSLQPA